MFDWSSHHLLLATAAFQLRCAAYAGDRGTQYAPSRVWVLQADMSPGGKPRNDRDFWGSVLGSDAIEQHDQQVRTKATRKVCFSLLPLML